MHETERPVRITRIVSGLIIGLVVGLAVITTLSVWIAKDDRPALTLQALDSAASRWAAAGPASYDLQVQLQGRRSDLIQLSVRDGRPVSLSVNNNPVRRGQSRDAWTVEGQFDIIQTDWQAAGDAADRGQFVMRAEFDPHLGYPLYYQHIELGGNVEIGWKLLEFKAIDRLD